MLRRRSEGIIQRVQIAADETCCAYERKRHMSVSRYIDLVSVRQSVSVWLVLSEMAKQCGSDCQSADQYADCATALDVYGLFGQAGLSLNTTDGHSL